MKRYLGAIGVLAFVFATPAQADVGLFIGLSVNTNGDFAVNGGVLSSNEEYEFVGAAGISWYPQLADQWGLTLGGGYQGDQWVALGAWDFLQSAPAFTVGYGYTGN